MQSCRALWELVGRSGNLPGAAGTDAHNPFLFARVCWALCLQLLQATTDSCSSFRPRQTHAAPSGRDRLLQLLQASTDACSSLRPRQTPAALSRRDKLLQLLQAPIAEHPSSGAESDTLCIASLSQGNNYLRCFRLLLSASRFLARISCKVCRACDACCFDNVFALGAFLLICWRSKFFLSGISCGMLRSSRFFRFDGSGRPC